MLLCEKQMDKVMERRGIIVDAACCELWYLKTVIPARMSIVIRTIFSWFWHIHKNFISYGFRRNSFSTSIECTAGESKSQRAHVFLNNYELQSIVLLLFKISL